MTWSFVLGFRSLVARLVAFESGGTKPEGEKILAIESVNSLRISAPPWWPLREGTDGKCEGRNEKCEYLARESVSSSPIVRIFGKGKCKFIANFSATMVTSLPSISLCISLSPKVPHAQYRKHLRASYNSGLEKSGRIVAFCDWKARFCDQKYWCSRNFAQNPKLFSRAWLETTRTFSRKVCVKREDSWVWETGTKRQFESAAATMQATVSNRSAAEGALLAHPRSRQTPQEVLILCLVT